MRIFALIPAYQPGERLVSLADELRSAGCSVVIVNDGSTPDKQSYFDRASKYAEVISHPHNMGKGAAIKTGIRHIALQAATIAGGAVLVVVDCDGQHLPGDAMKAAQDAASHPGSLVLGVRSVGPEMPLRSRLGNSLTRAVFKLLSGVYVSDTQTGLRAFDRSLFDALLDVEGDRYEYEMNVLMRFAKSGVAIREVKIKTIYLDRKNSVSHFRTFSDSYRVYAGMLRAADSHMLKFTLSSMLSFLVDYLLFNIFFFALESYNFGEVISNVAARVLSSAFNYKLNCTFVFKNKGSVKTILGYAGLAAIVLIFNSILLVGYTKLGLTPRIAKIFTEITLFIMSFLVQRFVIFRKKHSPVKAK